MNTQISAFISAVRDDGFTVRYRDRNGRHTFTASASGNALSANHQKFFESKAFNAGLTLTFGKANMTGEYTNFRAEVNAKTNSVPKRDADGNLERLPGWQWRLVKEYGKTMKAHDRTFAFLNDATDLGNYEVKLIEAQVAAYQGLAKALKARIDEYGLNDYVDLSK